MTRKLIAMKYVALFFLGLAVQAGSLEAEAPATGLTIDYVSVHPELWPKQVITKAAVQGAMNLNGGPSVPVIVPAGQLLKLVGMDGVTARLEYQGATVSLPAAQTDLLAGASAIHARLAGSARPPAVSVAPPVPGQRVLPAGMSEGPPSYSHSFGATLRDGLLVSSGNAAPEASVSGLARKKYIALYFSAHWCGPCQRFTPELVQFYQSRRKDADKFDVVFVSSDRSAKEMALYMREAQMPWLGVDFGRRDIIDRLKQQFAGPGIPCLVVLDERGQVVSNSYEGGRYVGPQKVLRDLSRLLDQG